jgi:hypothetical protein
MHAYIHIHTYSEILISGWVLDFSEDNNVFFKDAL